MTNLVKDICSASFKNERKLYKIFEPFFRAFSLEFFWYSTLTGSGKFTHVTTSPAMGEGFYEYELHKGHPSFKAPKYIPSCFLIPGKVSDTEYEKTGGKTKVLGGVDQLFMIVNNDGEKVTTYGFGTYIGRPDLTNSYVNNLMLFRKMIHLFHEECVDIVKQSEDRAVNIADDIGVSFYTPPTIYSKIVQDESAKIFHSKSHQQQFQALKELSKREKECVKWLLRGRSSTQIGKLMHISPRTVEFYTGNIRNKLCCQTREELFDCLLDWKDYILHVLF